MKADYLIENFKRYYPRLYAEAVEFIGCDWDELIILLDDGTRLLYDDHEHSFRAIPTDYNELSEEECRREFGRRLYKILRVKGVTQTELAEMTGIPGPMISNYIRGKRSPSFYKVDKIAKALQCSIEDLRYIW